MVRTKGGVVEGKGKKSRVGRGGKKEISCRLVGKKIVAEDPQV